MTSRIIVAVAALACGLPMSSAWAKHHAKHHDPVAATATQAVQTARPADEIQGVNPMTNAPPEAPAPNKKPFVAIPGVNPM